MSRLDKKKQTNLIQSLPLIGIGFGIGFLTAKLFDKRESFRDAIPARKPAEYFNNLDFVNRRKNFISLPFWLPVGNPVPTEVYYKPLSSAPHRILLSLPGSPPYEKVLPGANGNTTLVFEAPDNPNKSGDLGEVWFECQPLPIERRLKPYIFFKPDHSESTDTVKIIKFRCDVAEIKFVADLQKPYQHILQQLSADQLKQTCVDCGIAITGAGGSGYPNHADMARRAAIAAAASKDCRACFKETGEAVIRAMQEAVRAAQEAVREAERRRQEAEAEAARREVLRREKLYNDRSRDHRDVIRMNEACERYERWSRIA